MNVYNENGESIEEFELSAEVLEAEVNKHALHAVVRMQLANKRSGTASTKTRAEVKGSGRKLFRQKGTGMARAGMRRSPIRVGGGVAFGPRARDYSYRVPKKIRLSGIKSALADKFQNDDVFVIDSINIDRPKTKQLISIMNKLGIHNSKKVLIILDAVNENVLYSARNIPRVNVCVWDTINTYDTLWHDKLIITRNALEKIQGRFFATADA